MQLLSSTNFLPSQVLSYSTCLFTFFSCFTILLSLCCRCRGVCMAVLYELIGVAFLILNLFKIAAIGYSISSIFSNLSNPDSQIPILEVTLVTLSLGHIVLNFLAICLMRPRDCCGKFFKYTCGLAFWILFYHSLFYMPTFYLVCKLPCSKQKNQKALSVFFKHVMFLGWVGLQSSLLAFFYLFQNKAEVMISLVVLVLVWNCARISEALVFWCCRYQCHIRKKLYGPLKQYIKSLKQNREGGQQSTRRSLARCGSSMSATNTTQKTSDTTQEIPKAKNIPHIKKHQRIPSLQTALDSIKEVDFREELTYRLNEVMELSFNKDNHFGKFNSSPNSSPSSQMDPRWSMIQSPFVLTNEVRIEGLEGTDNQITDNSLALTSKEEGQIDEQATPSPPRDSRIQLQWRNFESARDQRRDMTPTGMRSGRGGSAPSLLQQSEFAKKRASLTPDFLLLNIVKETNEDLQEEIEEKEEHTAPETHENSESDEDSEEGGASERKESPHQLTQEESGLWQGQEIKNKKRSSIEAPKEPALLRKRNSDLGFKS